MSSLCQVRADTNLGIEKFYFSIFVPLFEIVLRSGCCGGGVPSSIRYYQDTKAHRVCQLERGRVRTACQSSERVPRRPAALKQCSVLCPCCLPVVRARAAPTRCTKAVQRAVSVLPCQSVRACAALTLCRLSGPPSTLCRLSGPPVHDLSRIPSAPTWDKMLLCGKICHKNGNLGNEKNQKPS